MLPTSLKSECVGWNSVSVINYIEKAERFYSLLARHTLIHLTMRIEMFHMLGIG